MAGVRMDILYYSSFDCPVIKYWFTSFSAQSWQYHDRRKPDAGTMPYSNFECLQGFFIMHSTIGSPVHTMPSNSLEHCIYPTTMTNIRPDGDSNLFPPGYKPQSIRMSHRDRPYSIVYHWMSLIPEDDMNCISLHWAEQMPKELMIPF